MLLIDELDATLHAFAQDNLLKLLCQASKELKLQVIATSHSLRVFEKAFMSKERGQIDMLFLVNEDGEIVQKQFSSYEEVANHLKVEATPVKSRRHERVSIIFEDDEGKALFKQICGSKLRNFLSSKVTNSLSAGTLKNLGDLSKLIPEMEAVILVPDGDMAAAWQNPPKNIVPLPGNERPETLIYEHLYSLSEKDPLWSKLGVNYSRQLAIVAEKGRQNSGQDKKWVKAWYRKQSKYWGKENAKVLKHWALSNKPLCLDFCQRFLKQLNKRLKSPVSKDVRERLLSQFKP